jgi:ribosomal protein S18 acetylase RimI-like enzyme
VLLRWSADSSLDKPALPDGFHIRPLAGENEVAAYVSLQRAVFGTDNMTEPWRRRIIHQPQYQPELDLVVSAPDGRLAAFCICWIDPNAAEGIIGQIEPLGVHENYRQLGLAKAILCEGLRRLRQLGAAWVYVQTDDFRDAAMQLYQAVGFQIYKKVLVFRKDFPVSPEKINDG